MATIAVLGTLDTKGTEHGFIAGLIRSKGHTPVLIDVGIRSPQGVEPDFGRTEVASAGGITPEELHAVDDRGRGVGMMAKAAAAFLRTLHEQQRIDGVISLGGSGGTAIASAAMQALPIGFPKLIVSTMVAGNVANYVGTRDITLMPSVVDVSGLNRISRAVFCRAAGAICGMVESPPVTVEDRPIIAVSMFGNTTECVNIALPLLEAEGFEPLVFHATGSGGRAMEALIESGMVAGVLDITTTEWADQLVGGILAAGPERLEAVAKAHVPAVVAPGCLDMVNFGTRDSIPPGFAGRTFYEHNPQITLMRTTPDECRALGSILAEKISRYTAPVTVLIPLQGISVISAPGQPFHDPVADAVLFQSLREGLRSSVPVNELECDINSPEFAHACVAALLQNIRQKSNASSD